MILLTVLSGCSGQGYVPVSDRSEGSGVIVNNIETPSRSGLYRVKNGDTLYSIAWRFGLDFRALARWNNIGNENRIYVGQTLTLKPKVQVAKVEKKTTKPPPVNSENKEKKVVTKKKSTDNGISAAKVEQVAVTSSVSSTSPSTNITVKNKQKKTLDPSVKPVWQWPANGAVITKFGSGYHGISIAGNKDDAVSAAADGQVILVSLSSRHYGNMLIINHNGQFLSAYAHNSRILVEVGDWVRAGQKIAEFGSSGAETVKLHFEMRRDGDPVDPLKYLPRKK